MNQKAKIKMGIELVMTILLLCQMAYMLIGETAHEWLGTAMFLLFIFHHIVNRKWYQNLLKGKYNPCRILQTAVDILVLLAMIGLMISGIMMSREVFAFLPIEGGMGFARILHMISAYWGFILMSIHLGFHWGMIMGRIGQIGGLKKGSVPRSWILRVLALLICIYGIYAFQKHHIFDYLFLKSQFVFFDMSQPLVQFFAEYLGMMGLWVCIAYYLSKWLPKGNKKKK